MEISQSADLLNDTDLRAFLLSLIYPLASVQMSAHSPSSISLTDTSSIVSQEDVLDELSDALGWMGQNQKLNYLGEFASLVKVDVALSVELDLEKIRLLSDKSRQSAMVDELLRISSPYSLFQTLFPDLVKKAYYSSRKKQLGLPANGGCPKKLDHTQECELLEIWEAEIQGNKWESLPMIIFTLYNKTKIKVCDFWPYFTSAFTIMLDAIEQSDDSVAVAPKIFFSNELGDKSKTPKKENIFVFRSANPSVAQL